MTVDTFDEELSEWLTMVNLDDGTTLVCVVVAVSENDAGEIARNYVEKLIDLQVKVTEIPARKIVDWLATPVHGDKLADGILCGIWV